MTRDETARRLASRICEAFGVPADRALGLSLRIRLDEQGCPEALLEVELRLPGEDTPCPPSSVSPSPACPRSSAT